MNVKKQFDMPLHYFRVVAILAIVFLHTISFSTQNIIHNSVVLTLFWFGSFYFVFISGYLCSFIESQRETSTIQFYFRKLRNVLCPYVVWTVIIWFFFYFFNGNSYHDLLSALPGLIYVLINGSMQGQYWYIVFIGFCFLITPILFRLGSKQLIILTVISSVIPIFVGRRGYYNFYDLSQMPSYIRTTMYFLPMYFRGFTLGFWPEKLKNFIRQNSKLITFLSILLTVVLFFCIYQTEFESKSLLQIHITALVYLQKLITTFFFNLFVA